MKAWKICLLCSLGGFVIILMASCLAGSPEPLVKSFVKKCETGDWTSAEGLLSDRAKMTYAQPTPLHDTYWPMLGLPFAAGISLDTINQKIPTAIAIISMDNALGKAMVSVKINNSAFLEPSQVKSILGKTGLQSVDIVIRFELILESNRWKIEKISPAIDQIEVQKWNAFAKMDPGAVTG